MAKSLSERNDDYLQMRIKMFNTVAFGTLLVSILAIIVSLVSRFLWYTWVISLVSLVIMLALIITVNLTKKYGSGSLYLSLVINLILFPSLFFTSGGTTGAVPLFFLIGILFSIIVLNGISLYLITFIEILFYIFLFWLTYIEPTLIPSIDSLALRNANLSVGLVIASLVAGNICRSLITQNKKERRRLDNLLKRDPLTKLYNRRYLMDVLNFYMSNETFMPLSVVLFDIDDFKKVNDTFGHIEGDRVLMNFGRVLLNNSDENVIASRYGGEEFMIVMPNMDYKSAKMMADSIRYQVEKAVGISKVVTCSGGVSQFDNEMSLEQFIKKADENLYKAKANGKNQII